jgi:hypothetical protein
VVVTDLEGAKQTAYAIADNRTAELAGWDDDQLAQSLARLQNDQTIDETIAGFTLDEIEAIQIPDFQPVGSEEQSKLDRTATHICPECGHEF